MDELLMSRVRQLQAIADRIDRIVAEYEKPILVVNLTRHGAELRQLERDVVDMIRAAEAEHEAF